MSLILVSIALLSWPGPPVRLPGERPGSGWAQRLSAALGASGAFGAPRASGASGVWTRAAPGDALAAGSVRAVRQPATGPTRAAAGQPGIRAGPVARRWAVPRAGPSAGLGGDRRTPAGASFVAAAALGTAVLAAVVAAALAGGATLGIASALVGATAWCWGRGHRRDRRRRVATVDLADGVRLVGRELRSGAEPRAAALQAATVARGAAVDVLRVIGTVRPSLSPSGFGPADVHAPRAQDDPAAVAARLRHAWDLSERHGIALGPLVDRIAADLGRRERARAERDAQLAGPRMSGYVLTGLPLVGLLLGVGMGADPVGVLTGGGLGGGLLLMGIALTGAGLLWSARIVRR